MPRGRQDEPEFDFDENEEDLEAQQGDEDFDGEYEDEDGEEDDEDYEDEDEEEGGNRFLGPLLLVVGGLIVVGGLGYAYMQGMLPFLPGPGTPAVQEAVIPSTPPPVSTAPPAASEAVAVVPTPEATPAPTEPPVPTPAPVEVQEQPAAQVQPVEVPAKVAAAAAKPAKAKVATLAARHGARAHKVQAAGAHGRHTGHAGKANRAHLMAGGGTFTVQCGAFAEASNARNLVASLERRGFTAGVSDGSGARSAATTVRSTVVNSRAKAVSLQKKFAGIGHPGSVLRVGRGRYVVQFGTFEARERAEELAREIRSKQMYVSLSGGTARLASPHRVYVGRFPSEGKAAEVARQVRRQGVPAIVVRL